MRKPLSLPLVAATTLAVFSPATAWAGTLSPSLHRPVPTHQEIVAASRIPAQRITRHGATHGIYCIGAPLNAMVAAAKTTIAAGHHLTSCPAGAHAAPAAPTAASCIADYSIFLDRHDIPIINVGFFTSAFAKSVVTCDAPVSLCEWTLEFVVGTNIAVGDDVPAISGGQLAPCTAITDDVVAGALPNVAGDEGFAVAGGGLVVFPPSLNGIS